MSWKAIILTLCVVGGLAMPSPARAEFIITSAIVEFPAGSPAQADIDVVSHGKDTDYIVTNVDEIIHPGATDESRHAAGDPGSAGLIVTPAKMVLPGGGRKVLRFVLMHPLDAQEHIYRVDLRPVVRGLDSNARVGLKILVGYEVLVIVRPDKPVIAYEAQRSGKSLTIVNSGNTNVLFEDGTQCAAPSHCATALVARVYAGQRLTVALPADAPVDYTIWDGQATAQKHFD